MNQRAQTSRDAAAAKLPDMSNNPMADRAKTYLLAIDDEDFWADDAVVGRDPIALLRDLTGAGGLAIRGSGYSHRARMDAATGEITVTWTEVVADDHGGHDVERMEVLS